MAIYDHYWVLCLFGTIFVMLIMVWLPPTGAVCCGYSRSLLTTMTFWDNFGDPKWGTNFSELQRGDVRAALCGDLKTLLIATSLFWQFLWSCVQCDLLGTSSCWSSMVCWSTTIIDSYAVWDKLCGMMHGLTFQDFLLSLLYGVVIYDHYLQLHPFGALFVKLFRA